MKSTNDKRLPRYVAFLRGINVGGHRVKMDRLRTMFEDLGFEDVSTFIASGNVLFTAHYGEPDALREGIEGHLAHRLGYEVPTFLRSPSQLAEVVAFTPPPVVKPTAADPSHYVIFLDTGAPDSLRPELTRLNSEIDHFYFAETEVHWHIQGKLTDSPLFAAGLDQATRGVRTTMRNMNTLRRIAARWA